MSLNRSFWLSVASISSHQYKASDSQLFTYYEVNRLLTAHFETHFHLNVIVVYLPTNHWGWHSHFPSPNWPWLFDCHWLRWHAERDLSVYILHLSLQLAHPCREHTPFFFCNDLLQEQSALMICDVIGFPLMATGLCSQFSLLPSLGHECRSVPHGKSCVLHPPNPVLCPCHVLQTCLLFFSLSSLILSKLFKSYFTTQC